MGPEREHPHVPASASRWAVTIGLTGRLDVVLGWLDHNT